VLTAYGYKFDVNCVQFHAAESSLRKNEATQPVKKFPQNFVIQLFVQKSPN